jgi:hypothetical protein
LDTTETAIIRLVVDDPESARRLLKENGFAFTESQLLVVEIDSATQLPDLMSAFLEAEVNINYMYCFIPHPEGKSILGVSMEDIEVGERVLTRHSFRVLRQSDVSRGAKSSASIWARPILWWRRWIRASHTSSPIPKATG